MSLCVNILRNNSHLEDQIQFLCVHILYRPLAKILSRKIFLQPFSKQLWNTFFMLDLQNAEEPNPQVSWSFLACLDHTLRNSCPVGRFEQSLLLIQCCYVSALFIWPARKICSSRHKIFFNTTNSPLRGISVAAICIKMRSWVHREIWNLCF